MLKQSENTMINHILWDETLLNSEKDENNKHKSYNKKRYCGVVFRGVFFLSRLHWKTLFLYSACKGKNLDSYAKFWYYSLPRLVLSPKSYLVWSVKVKREDSEKKIMLNTEHWKKKFKESFVFFCIHTKYLKFRKTFKKLSFLMHKPLLVWETFLS